MAFTYEAGTHCIACTHKTFGQTFTDMFAVSNYFLPDDREGNRIQALFRNPNFDENIPVQDVACDTCHDIIEEMTL